MLYIIEMLKALGRPTKEDMKYSAMEMDLYMKGHGATHTKVRPGMRLRRKRSKPMEPGEVRVVATVGKMD